VESQLVPILETHNFQRVDIVLGQSDWPVSGRELRLERRFEKLIDSITFNFQKYGAARVQVHCSRRAAEMPNAFVRSANLVARSDQYYHFWGKPWWLPSKFWSGNASRRTIDRIGGLLDQVLRFIETEERGANISRPTGASLDRRPNSGAG
jgi:hypothetical protein